MLPFRSITASLALLLALFMAACGPGPKPDEASAPTPSEESTTSANPPVPTPSQEPEVAVKEEKKDSSVGSFLNFLPPKIHPPKEVEKPVFHIYYDLEGIPDSWIDEWKAGRDIKISQIPLSADPSNWPKDADLVIAGPDRLDHKNLRTYPVDAPLVRANPAFLHHPFDPEQTFTRPWRWTPWVLMRHTPAEAGPGPSQSAAIAATEPVWTNRPDVARGWWLKSLHLSANHPMPPALAEKWQAQLALIIPLMEPIDTLWGNLVEGKTRAAILPLSWKLRQPSDRVSWSVPATGTLIHIDQLAMGLDSDQPELALECVAFLSDPARQKALTETTGYYPVQRPLGREIPDIAGPPPPWWDRSEFLIGTPAPRKIPVQAAELVKPATADGNAAEKKEEVKPAAAQPLGAAH